MNLFVVLGQDGPAATASTYELVTPPLDGMILPGVTRDSVLTLARDHTSGKNPLDGLQNKNVIVSERPITMNEVKEASLSGKLVELFGAGESYSALIHISAWSDHFIYS